MMKPYLQRVSLTDRKKKKIEKQIQKTLRDLSKDPDNYKHQIEIGDSYCLLEEYEQAEEHYASAIELLHQAPFKEKASKQIIMLYGKILSFAPDREDAYLKLGEEYIAAGQKEKASRFLLSSAKKAFDSENYELALECYNMVIEMGKSNPYIIERTTELYLKLGKKQDAIANYIQIGDIYANEEKHIEALGYYKKAHALEPEEPGMIGKIAGAYQTIGWTENAAVEFLKMAAHFEQQHNYAEAMKYYTHSLELDPENQKAKMGKQRIEEANVIPVGEKIPAQNLTFDDQDILEELDLMEKTPENQMELPEMIDLTESDSSVVNFSERLAAKASAQNHQDGEDEPGSGKNPKAISIEERLIDVNEEDLVFEDALNEHPPILTETIAYEPEDFSSKQEAGAESEWNYEQYERFQPDSEAIEGEQTNVNTDIEFIAEELLNDVSEDNGQEETRRPDHQEEEGEHAETGDMIRQELEHPLEEDSHQTGEELLEVTDDMMSLEPEATAEPPEKQEEVELPEVTDDMIILELEATSEQPPEEPIEVVGEIVTQGEEDPVNHIEPSPQGEVVEVTDGMFVHEEPSPPEGYVTMEQLFERVEDLEKHLQSTQEEKYFLQEQFTAQIAQMKSREVSIVQELEKISGEKRELEQRVKRLTTSRQRKRTEEEKSNEARYEAIIDKIQQKKHVLQEQLHSLLKQREENTRSFTQDLKNLSATKLHLQQNLEYIQQVKARLEEKVNGELRQAKQEVETLTQASEELKRKLHSQQQLEKDLRTQFDELNREKVSLEDQFTETVSALTGENETLEQRLQELARKKQGAEETLKKKFQSLHGSYRRLKGEYKKSIQSKEQELQATAKRLNEFGEKYVKLEKTLTEIRQERDKLEDMLTHESATREMLEEKLCDIEVQVDSLEVHGTELLQQFGQELDRQFSMEQGASEKFMSSLDELEKLLALQEQEIQSLETI